MKPKLQTRLFVAWSVVQIGVTMAQIARHEYVLREGRVYRFACAPVDPADAFRGRYVEIRLVAAMATQSVDHTWVPDQWLCAPLVTDADGLTWFGPLARRPPTTGDWLRVRYQWGRPEEAQVRVAPPFDRLYLPERVAPEVEKEFVRQTAASEGNRPPVVVVRVAGGRGVIEDLELEGVSVRQWRRPRASDHR